MEKRRGPKTAQYPPTDGAEQKAVDTLNYLLDESVKSHLNSRDKTPNHDGYLELVDQNNEPTGRINVQVRKLGDGREEPTTQIESKHLAYCYRSRNPFIFILVDVEEDVAYWGQITEEWYERENLHSKKSISVTFPEGNRISASDREYVNDWRQIVKYWDSPFFKLDKPPVGATNWGYRVNQNFDEIERCISHISDELGVSVNCDYEKPERGQKNWHIPLNDNFGKIEEDVNSLASVVGIEIAGEYVQPRAGRKNWHVPLNYNFLTIEEDVRLIAEAMHDLPMRN